jgi:N-acetyl-1-D-myo-inositol-2-amino-2-deoxy-alpha-D-glucopyranoside deacetylase
VAARRGKTRLVGVFAHPDDDVYTLGGSLVLERERLEMTLVFCTSGDAGPIWIDGVEPHELGRVREREQAASMDALGIDADVRFLRHPDFHLPNVPAGVLESELDAVFRETQPHLVVTFGADGLTGHHDHIAVGAATDAAFHRARTDEGIVARLLHVGMPRSAVALLEEQLRALGDPAKEERSLLALRGVPDDRIAVTVDTRPVRETKLAGIEAHRTQIGELERLPEALRWIVLDTEWFMQAWPERPASPAAPATSITGTVRDA